MNRDCCTKIASHGAINAIRYAVDRNHSAVIPVHHAMDKNWSANIARHGAINGSNGCW
jgi:hypothetical protein